MKAAAGRQQIAMAPNAQSYPAAWSVSERTVFQLETVLMDIPAGLQVEKQTNIDFYIIKFLHVITSILTTYLGNYPRFPSDRENKLRIVKRKINGLSAQRVQGKTGDGISWGEYLFTLPQPEWRKNAHLFYSSQSLKDRDTAERIIGSVRPLWDSRRLIKIYYLNFDSDYDEDPELIKIGTPLLFVDHPDDVAALRRLIQPSRKSPIPFGKLWIRMDFEDSGKYVLVAKNGVVRCDGRDSLLDASQFDSLRKRVDGLYAQRRAFLPQIRPYPLATMSRR